LFHRSVESIHVNVYNFSIWNNLEHDTNLNRFSVKTFY
jgi:hypothetical protein